MRATLLTAILLLPFTGRVFGATGAAIDGAETMRSPADSSPPPNVLTTKVLGLIVRDLKDDEHKNLHGVLVESAAEAAKNAGVRAGSLIDYVSIGSSTAVTSVRQLDEILANAKPNKYIGMHVCVPGTYGGYPYCSWEQIAPPAVPTDEVNNALGLIVSDLSEAEKKAFSGKDDISNLGVIVEGVEGPAKRAGIRVGDVISTFQGYLHNVSITDAKQFNGLARQLDPEYPTVVVCYQRGTEKSCPAINFVEPPLLATPVIAVSHQRALAAAKSAITSEAKAKHEFLNPTPLPNTAPFGYTNGPNGTTLFYHLKCPAEKSDQWELAILVGRVTRWRGCWIKYQDKHYKDKDETVTFCTTTKNDLGNLVLGNSCLHGSASGVLKGNPLPERAF